MRCHASLLTPPGAGGVAVVELVGVDALEVAVHLLRDARGRPVRLDVGGRPVLARLHLDGEDVDEVLVVRRRHSIELHLHASSAVVAALERTMGLAGAPAASPAELLLRHATGVGQLALALEQRDDDFDRFLESLAALPAPERSLAVAAARRRSLRALALALPSRLVLCGRQNAGKSTLMNRLLFMERVATGPTPGLTRDPVTETVSLEGYPYELIDTAGEGDTVEDVDHLAIERARAMRAGSVLLVVVDGSRGPGRWEAELVGARTLFVRAKSDLPAAPWPERLRPVIAVSALRPESAPSVRRAIGHALRDLLARPPAGPVGGPAALTLAQMAALDALDAASGGSPATPG